VAYAILVAGQEQAEKRDNADVRLLYAY
jgi:hypothetical protein